METVPGLLHPWFDSILGQVIEYIMSECLSNCLCLTLNLRETSMVAEPPGQLLQVAQF